MTEKLPGSPDDPISIPLHPKHWVILVSAVDLLNQQAMKRVAELRQQGIDHTTLPEATVTALTAPMIVRGILVKELTARGVMTEDANKRFGYDRISEEIRKYRDGV